MKDWLTLSLSGFALFCIVQMSIRTLHKYYKKKMVAFCRNAIESSNNETSDISKKVEDEYLRELNREIFLNQISRSKLALSRKIISDAEYVVFFFAAFYVSAIDHIGVITSAQYLLAILGGWLGIKGIASSSQWSGYYLGRIHFYNFLSLTFFNCFLSLAAGLLVGWLLIMVRA